MARRSFITKPVVKKLGLIIFVIFIVFFLIAFLNSNDKETVQKFFVKVPLLFSYDNTTITFEDLLLKKYGGPSVRKVFDKHVIIEYPLVLESVDEFQTMVLDQLPYLSKVDKTRNNFDRQMTQIHIMNMLNKTLSKQKNLKPKVVYMNHKDKWDHIDFNQCGLTNCVKSLDLSTASSADAVLYANSGKMPIEPDLKRSNQDQVWMMWIDESSTRSWDMSKYQDWFNWTLTYRHDAVITKPYMRFNFSDSKNKKDIQNFAFGRKKKVAWFVSNCYYTRSGRQDYAKELSKHIEVDIYGKCGKNKCEQDCVKMLGENYKFYLAFENHRCHEYITEKIERPYRANVLPIVLGASKEEYARVLPDRSFIHVDDFDNPKDLAEYLHKLDKNDTLYNEYFKWKYTTTGLMDPVPWCRMCALLNQPNIPRIWYDTLDKHWRTDKCIRRQSWKNVTSYEKLFIGQPHYQPNV